MTKYDVQQVMGEPAKSEFSGGVYEWHYCKTDWSVDSYLALFFYKDKLIEQLNYSVTRKEAGGSGDCSIFVKKGNYVVPDRVVEIRNSENPVKERNSF